MCMYVCVSVYVSVRVEDSNFPTRCTAWNVRRSQKKICVAELAKKSKFHYSNIMFVHDHEMNTSAKFHNNRPSRYSDFRLMM